MITFVEWLKESFIVGTHCARNPNFQVWGAQSDAHGGKGCPHPPGSDVPLTTTNKPPKKKKKS
jgi:hypothetical protein